MVRESVGLGDRVSEGAAMSSERMRQFEEVKEGERRVLMRSEFERFEAGELRFVCNGQRMKPQKVRCSVSENTHEMWWVEFRRW